MGFAWNDRRIDAFEQVLDVNTNVGATHALSFGSAIEAPSSTKVCIFVHDIYYSANPHSLQCILAREWIAYTITWFSENDAKEMKVSSSVRA